MRSYPSGHYPPYTRRSAKRSHNWRTDKNLDPDKRTKLFMEELGYICKIVEYFDGMSHNKRDFLGCGDILACQDGFKILIQATDDAHHANRREKIEKLFNWERITDDNVGRLNGRLICEWVVRDQLWLMSWKEPAKGEEYVPRVEAMMPSGKHEPRFPNLKLVTGGALKLA